MPSTVVLVVALQTIRKSLLDGSSSSSSSWDSQQPQADALEGYNGDPLLFVSDKAAADDAAANIQMPAAPLLYGYSVGLCLGSGLSEPGGAGLGTLGLSEVSKILCACWRKLHVAYARQACQLLQQGCAEHGCPVGMKGSGLTRTAWRGQFHSCIQLPLNAL
jgi:hypothetical protein